MEWVEVTGKTIEEAKEIALDQLGVDESEAEFQVLDEPRGGLFGRLRSEARVRARVAPTAPRPKAERGDRRRPRRRSGGGHAGSEGGGGREGKTGATGSTGATPDRTDQPAGEPDANASAASQRSATAPRRRRDATDKGGEMTDEESAELAEAAESFLSGLLETMGASYTLERRRPDGETVEVAVAGTDLGVLIGERGRTLSAVQELTRTVVQRKVPGHKGRVVVDIAGYREARREALTRFASEVAAQVKDSGVPRVFEPMPPADRKVIHDTVNEIPGVATTSEGEEPRRRVVISPSES